ncbi:MAG: MBL fold metallo-hydrolase [Clostridiales bacterium]|nr:MBL fold metallo-hydrolase [Clostridiales bacterium]
MGENLMTVKSAVIGDMGNNCYLITDEDSGKSALIDCTEYSADMLRLIDGAHVELILLTHGHFDHIGGVYEMQKNTGAVVMISQEDAEMLTSSKKSLAAFCGVRQTALNEFKTFKDNDVIMLGSTEIRVLATPGHTKGSVCFVAGGCIFSGDTLFYCSCGRTDFPGGSFKEMQKSLKRLALLSGDYRVCPGHDSETTLEFERKNNPYMKNI